MKAVLVGRDGAIRGATVRVAGQGWQASTLNHPIQLLYPLEVSKRTSEPVNSPEPLQNNDSDPDDNLEGQIPVRHSRHATALEAQNRLLAQALNSEN